MDEYGNVSGDTTDSEGDVSEPKFTFPAADGHVPWKTRVLICVDGCDTDGCNPNGSDSARYGSLSLVLLFALTVLRQLMV